MRIYTRSALRDFWAKHSDAEAPLKAWFQTAQESIWLIPQDVKATFATASILKNGRVVFDVAGNKYRLVVAVLYSRQSLFIKFIGTHREYDKVDAQTVDYVKGGK